MQARQAFGTIAAAMAAFALVMGIGRFSYSALLPIMQNAGFNDRDAGLVAGVNLAAYLLGSWGCANVPESRWRLGFALALVVSVLSTAAMALPLGLGGWLVLRGLSGVASAGGLVLGAALMMAHLAAVGRLSWAGLSYAGVGLGLALSGGVARMPFSQVGAGGGWLALGGLSVLLLPLALGLVMGKPAVVVGPLQDTVEENGGYLFRLRLAYGLEGLGYSVTATFLVAVIAKASGDLDLATSTWVIAGVAAVPGFWVGRWLTLRLGARRAMMWLHGGQAVAIALPVFSVSSAAAMAAAVGFGGTFLALVGLALAEGRRLGGAKEIGQLTAIYGLGQALAPPLAGWLTEHSGSWNGSLLAAAVCVGLGGLVLWQNEEERITTCRT